MIILNTLIENISFEFRSEINTYRERFINSNLDDLIDDLSTRSYEDIIGFLPLIMIAMLQNVKVEIYSNNSEMIYYLLDGNGRDPDLNRRAKIIFDSLNSVQRECVYRFLKFFNDMEIEQYAHKDLASCVEYWDSAHHSFPDK